LSGRGRFHSSKVRYITWKQVTYERPTSEKRMMITDHEPMEELCQCLPFGVGQKYEYGHFNMVTVATAVKRLYPTMECCHRKGHPKASHGSWTGDCQPIGSAPSFSWPFFRTCKFSATQRKTLVMLGVPVVNFKSKQSCQLAKKQIVAVSTKAVCRMKRKGHRVEGGVGRTRTLGRLQHYDVALQFSH
jgi:hypothetical protein